MLQKNIFTIGHSTHTLDEFLTILKSFNIEILADIRGLPGSRRFPWFNMEALSVSLSEAGISYIHLPGLGGRRKVKKDSKNTRWRNDAFRGYADYMETEEFENAVSELEKLATEQRTVIMCAESLWWRCHRSLVSDNLKLKGWNVTHITGRGKGTEHSYSQPARIHEGVLKYSDEV